MKVTYYDPKSQIRLLCYADTVVWDTKPTPTLTALRFGGYPERVQGLADAIYGGATIEIEDGKDTYSLKTLTRQYRRELSHDGVYAEATLIAEDDGQSAKQNAGDKDEPDKDKNDEDDDQIQQDLPPRNTYIFCTPGERRELFDAVDQKTAVPMIPEYQDYVLTELQKRNILRPLQVKSLSRKLEAWLLRCEEKDKNIVAVMEDGLKSGAISIPGATVGLNPLDEINSITEYLNTFGVTVAERIDTSSRSGQETAIVRRSLPPRILPGSAVELRLCSAAASRSRTACWRRRPAGFVSGDAKGGKTNESNTEKQDAHPDGGSPGTGGRA